MGLWACEPVGLWAHGPMGLVLGHEVPQTQELMCPTGGGTSRWVSGGPSPDADLRTPYYWLRTPLTTHDP